PKHYCSCRRLAEQVGVHLLRARFMFTCRYHWCFRSWLSGRLEGSTQAVGWRKRRTTMNRRSMGVRQLVSVLSVVAWAACGSVTASATAAKPANKCEADSSFVPVQAGTIQEMVARGAPVALKHVLIDGPDLDLARRVVGQPFIIRDSIVLSNLDLTDTVFTDRFEIRDTCAFGMGNGQLPHFNTGLDLVRSVLRNKISLYAATI